jgi:hypothetical protein
VRVILDDQQLQIRLSWWQKLLGLMRDITLPVADVHDVEVEEDGVGVAMRGGIKVGLRLPWLYFVARTIKLDRAFIVRRGVPALSFGVTNHGALKHVVVCAPDARELAERLRAPSG